MKRLTPLINDCRKALNLVCLIQLLFVASCASVATDTAKNHSESRADTGYTYFGKLAAGWRELHGTRSGFFPLSQGMDALGVQL